MQAPDRRPQADLVEPCHDDPPTPAEWPVPSPALAVYIAGLKFALAVCRVRHGKLAEWAVGAPSKP